MQFVDAIFGTVKNRTLVLSGYVSSVKVENEQLVVKDGLKDNVVERCFSRASCPFDRVITTQPEGSISLSALHWLSDVGVSVACLRYDGTPLMVSCPRPPEKIARTGEAGIVALRRRQAQLTLDSEPGRSIAFTILNSKVAGQIELLKTINPSIAEAVEERAVQLSAAYRNGDLRSMLTAEGNVAVAYWRSLAAIPVHFATRDRPSVPAHWTILGPRRSPLTKSPQRAATPAQAVLNYLLAVAISEICIACHAAGLDPALGILHSDKAGRASLAYDLIELMRPSVDRWFLALLSEHVFSKRDFFEASNGTISITRPLTSHLAMTSALWRPLATDLVQWFVGEVRELADHQLDDRNPAYKSVMMTHFPPRLGTRPIAHTCLACGAVVPSLPASRQRKRWLCPECRIPASK